MAKRVGSRFSFFSFLITKLLPFRKLRVSAHHEINSAGVTEAGFINLSLVVYCARGRAGRNQGKRNGQAREAEGEAETGGSA